ncbi:two pore domain potassium channel family protein [Oenococcus sicerae]|uniref:Two pore domain potassium channel family protein n=1 Tax=Oenococcus sicerae TaxID=2203724 RepID=A0ABX5QN49_9LACO|nr:ion channel [Oenococcus sicerae]QAS70230.1 two pore domain potassium channel family protein [Oenococcus sicerae]
MKTKLLNIFLYLLAAVSIPLAFMDTSKAPLMFVDWGIWIIFVFDYFFEFKLAKNKKSYVKHHIIELISIIPFNAFPAFRILRIVRVFAFSGRFLHKTKDFLIETKVYIAFIITGIILIISGLLFAFYQRDNFLDGLLWALGVATTSGSPFTATKMVTKIVNIILMFTGIGLVGYFTGALASWLTKDDISNADIDKKLNKVLDEINQIKTSKKEE